MGLMGSRYKIRVVSGPSGSGKSSLINKLKDEYGEYLSFCISHTTRSPREGEINGIDYHFITREKFMNMVNKNEFIEYTEFSKNLYGSSKKALESATKDSKICIIDVDMNGVKALKKTRFRPIFIFIKPLSIDVLETRLKSRKSEHGDEINRRINTAHEALAYAEEKNVYHHIIVNDNMDEAYANFKQLFIKDFERIKDSSKSRKRNRSE